MELTKVKIDYTEEFNEAWLAYPKRDGSSSKKQALNKYTSARRIHSHEVIMNAIKNYHDEVASNGRINTPYVKMFNAWLCSGRGKASLSSRGKFLGVDHYATEDKIHCPDAKWLNLRYFALKSAGGRCCLCGQSAKDGIELHVDHIKPKSLFPELALDADNLQVLCSDCNMGKSNKDDTDWRK